MEALKWHFAVGQPTVESLVTLMDQLGWLFAGEKGLSLLLLLFNKGKCFNLLNQ
jgi:hypothetical protein